MEVPLYHKGLREAAIWWFKKWLVHDDKSVYEPELTIQKDEDLQVTLSGQVLDECKKGSPDPGMSISLFLADKAEIKLQIYAQLSIKPY